MVVRVVKPLLFHLSRPKVSIVSNILTLDLWLWSWLNRCQPHVAEDRTYHCIVEIIQPEVLLGIRPDDVGVLMRTFIKSFDPDAFIGIIGLKRLIKGREYSRQYRSISYLWTYGFLEGPEETTWKTSQQTNSGWVSHAHILGLWIGRLLLKTFSAICL